MNFKTRKLIPEQMDENLIDKNLILREQLSIQRTVMANQTTFLSFIRTALYLLIAGLSVNSLLKIDHGFALENILFASSFFVFCFGIFNFIKHKKLIIDSEKHIGNYKMEYFK